uniref:Uncharacterized protein n=1 Tax=Polysiphonia scopulorum TaxID=257860 RepID=A0A1Z1MHM7_9FLOR|nr:hypothetical protein [Polysiphonia scopulorum]ARW65568.1 hypothetical protein [Polysiphonia scopulorum]
MYLIYSMYQILLYNVYYQFVNILTKSINYLLLLGLIV